MRRPTSRRSRRWFAGGLVLSLVAGLGGSLWFYWDERLRYAYPIQYVRIEGRILNLDDAALSDAIAPLAKAGFFAVDLAAIESIGRSFAWVGDIRVVRQWPDTLIVRISEHQPAARWNRVSLLSDRGVRFTPPKLAGFESLADLSGPEGQEGVVFQSLKRLDAVMDAHHVRVAALTLTPRQSWTATLSDGKEVVIGRQDPVLCVQRLFTWLPELEHRQIASVKRIDLRYRQGFTVVLGKEPQSEAVTIRDGQANGVTHPPKPSASSPIPQVAALQW